MFELLEGCKGKLELLEVVARGHKVWGPQVLAKVMGNVAVNDSWWDWYVVSQAIGEGEELLHEIVERHGGVIGL